MLKDSTSSRSGFSKLDILVALGVILILTALILPAIQQARIAARRTLSRNNLKMLALAFHNYHDVYSTLPPGGTVMANGQGHHGWFTRLGPYLEVTPYYVMVDFDRRWNDRVNQHLFQLTPMTALRPDVSPVATREGFVVTHYSANPSVLYRNSSVKLEDFEHGTNHEWVLGDVAGNFEPWGSPFNWRPAGKPLNSGNDSYGGWNGGAQFVMADGSVRFVSEEMQQCVSVAFNGGLPTPIPEQRKRPVREWEYLKGNAGISIDSTPLDDLEWDGLILEVFNDREELPQTALIRPRGKWSERSPTVTDLRQVVETCPHVRILLVDIDIDEEASRLLASLRKLEVVRTPSVEVSPKVVDHLRRLPLLDELIIRHIQEDDLRKLRSHLPGVLIVRETHPETGM